jgi:hypothetical protein
VHPIDDLPRVWPSIDLPGYREHPEEYATYSGFDFDALPPIERHLDDELGWLLSERLVPASLADVEHDVARPATSEELALLLAGETIALPQSFSTFIESAEPRRHVRSCTDCYLDLGDFVVPVPGGGTLVHFLSDQQWVFHWFVCAALDGSEAVVVTDRPFGFELSDEDEYGTLRAFDGNSPAAAVCSESFSAFLFRFWIENEIWFKLTEPGSEAPLTDEQRRYAEHYSRG